MCFGLVWWGFVGEGGRWLVFCMGLGAGDRAAGTGPVRSLVKSSSSSPYARAPIQPCLWTRLNPSAVDVTWIELGLP